MQAKWITQRKDRGRVVLTGVAIGILYWVAESCVESLLLQETGFLDAFLRPGLRDIADRTIVLSILVPVAIFVQVRTFDCVTRLLRDHKKRIGIVSWVASVFVSFEDEEAYAHALQVILEATGSRHGVLGYVDEKGDLVCASMTRGVWDECKIPDKRIVFKRESWAGLWGRALKQKRTLYSNTQARVPEGHIAISRNLATPVVHRGNVIGLLHVANKASNYDSRDAGLLEAVAEHVAPILHARLQTDRQKEACRMAQEELGELARSNTQLEQMNLKLVEFDEMKSDFLSNVSHELRTPLASVRAYAESILEYEMPQDQRESFLRIILEQSERLTSVLDDLLDLAKIEAGELKLSLEPVGILRAAVAAIESVKPLAEKKDVRLSVVQASTGGTVVADEQRLIQVLVNLLNNAVKFTGPGGVVAVSFTAATLPAGAPASAASAGNSAKKQATHLRVTVTDTGEGIPTDELGRIFDRFKQVADKNKRSRPGTGLGLAICRQLVEKMGGSIWVESIVGKGSSFHFTIPLYEGIETARGAPFASVLSGAGERR